MLCNRIKQFRTYNNIETESLAKILKIEHSEYLKYESGEKIPNIDIITTLSEIYKVTVNEFYGNEPRILALTNKNFEAFNDDADHEVLKFAELSVDEKELILAYRTNENKERILELCANDKK